MEAEHKQTGRAEIDLRTVACPRRVKIALNRLAREQLCYSTVPFPDVDLPWERFRSRMVIRSLRRRRQRLPVESLLPPHTKP